MSHAESSITQLHPAAEAGDSQAQFRLAVLYRNAGDLVEAQRWARLSARAGVVNAQLLLATFLGGVGPDPALVESTRNLWRAAALYLEASGAGNETGSTRLRELIRRLADEGEYCTEEEEFDFEEEVEAPALLDDEDPVPYPEWDFELAFIYGGPWRIDKPATVLGEVLEIALDGSGIISAPCPMCDQPSNKVGATKFRWRSEDFQGRPLVVSGELPRFRCAEHDEFPAPLPWTRDKSFFAVG